MFYDLQTFMLRNRIVEIAPKSFYIFCTDLMLKVQTYAFSRWFESSSNVFSSPIKRLYTPWSCCFTVKQNNSVKSFYNFRFSFIIYVHCSQSIKVHRDEIFHCVTHEWKRVIAPENQHDLILPTNSEIVPLIWYDNIGRWNGHHIRFLVYAHNRSGVVSGTNQDFNDWIPDEIEWRECNLDFVFSIHTYNDSRLRAIEEGEFIAFSCCIWLETKFEFFLFLKWWNSRSILPTINLMFEKHLSNIGKNCSRLIRKFPK